MQHHRWDECGAGEKTQSLQNHTGTCYKERIIQIHTDLIYVKMEWGTIELCTVSSEMQLTLHLPIFSRKDLQCGELWARTRPPCHGQSFSTFISPSLKEMQERK